MNNVPVVVCTSCHNQHEMNVVNVANKPFVYNATTPAAISGTPTGLPAGNYATMFFIRAPYNPADPNPLTNQTAQFCRQCHGGESNEASGSSAGTVF
jgi:nitrate/TMAO reductase-like tetraheme cytochrome c subunit